MKNLTNNFMQRVMNTDGYIDPKSVAMEFHTTIRFIASITGLAITTLNKKSRSQSTAAQQRLQEMVRIINRVTP